MPVLLILLALLSLAALAGGVALCAGGTILAGILLIVLGLFLGAVAGGLVLARRLRASLREWREVLAGGPEQVRIVRVQPPPGFLFRREATITLEVHGRDGATKQVERGLRVPIPQAVIWKLAGRVPLPLGGLAEARELNLPVYRRRKP